MLTVSPLSHISLLIITLQLNSIMIRYLFKREGHGAVVRARRFVNVATCSAVSNLAWCGIFREISCFFPLNIGTLFQCCVLGQGTQPSNASLDSGENEYLVGQRWQCVQVQCAEMPAGLYAATGDEMTHK